MIWRALLWIGSVGLVIVALAILAVGSAQRREHLDRQNSRPHGSTFIAAYDTRVLMQRRGSASAPAVVFIGGTGGWSGLWDRYMTKSVGLGYQAVALDLPPFGYAIPPASGDYSKLTQGRRLLGALDSLGLKNVTVVVHSFGAALVMEGVFLQPGRFSKLILIDPALGLDGPQTDGKDWSVQALLRKAWIRRPVTSILTNPMLTGALLRRAITEKDRADAYWIDLYRQPLQLRDASMAISMWIPEVLARRGHAASDDINAYGSLNLPVTIIWGERDTLTPLPQGIHLQKLIPGATLVVIPGAGHGPQIEEPALFEQALVNALKPSSIPKSDAMP